MAAHRKRGPEPGTFGWRLREARQRAGLSAPKVARRAGAKISTYYSWESGDRMPRDIVKLAKAAKTTVGALFGEAS